MYSSNGSIFWVWKVSPFGNLRILRLFAPPRSLSQLVTSFIGSQCQGILHILFFAWTTFSKQVSFETNWFTLVLRFFSRLNCCVYHTCSLQDLVFIFVWQNCLIFTLTEKPDFNFNWFLSFPLLLSVMYVTQILSKESIWFLLFGFQWTFP